MPCTKPMLVSSALAILLAACGGGSGTSVNAGGQAPAPTPSSTPTASPTPTPVASGVPGAWQLVWSDEFTGSAIDTSVWNMVEDCWGGGNEERQCYTARPQNIAVANGNLVITAIEEAWTGDAWPADMKPHVADPDAQKTGSFTSGKLTTQGKLSWRYGKMEMRARLPQGQGVWPAFWMMPRDNVYGTWAASGEIDILETINLGVICADCPAGGENRIYGSLHYGGQWPDNVFSNRRHELPEILNGGYHVFGLIWEEGRFTWTIDGQPYGSREAHEWFTTGSANPNAPFDEEFYLIVNLAIGGRWPEQGGLGGVSSLNFPKRLEVDWIRVYQCEADPGTGKGCAQGN